MPTASPPALVRVRAPSPIGLGVTGHAFLGDPELVEAGIELALTRVIRSFGPGPLTVYSALAEGADRMVARRALAYPDAKLIAVLPLPVDEYRKDFGSEASREEFEELLARCAEPPIVVGKSRPEGYVSAGQRIVELSTVMIAVWDGQLGGRPGGTGSVVRAARAKGRPVVQVHAKNLRPGSGVAIAAPAGTVSDPETVLKPAVIETLPYVIRVGIGGEPRGADVEAVAKKLAEQLPAIVADLFDESSRPLVKDATETEIQFVTIGMTEGSSGDSWAHAISEHLGPSRSDRRASVDIVNASDIVLLVGDVSDGARGRLEALAIRRKRPVVVVDPLGETVEVTSRGSGLNARPIERLDRFNRRIRAKAALPPPGGSKLVQDFSAAADDGVNPVARTVVRERILGYYGLADGLALQYQRAYQRAGLLVWTMFPLVLAAVAIGILEPTFAVAAHLVEIGLIGGIVLVVSLADKSRSLEQWVEARYLAERLRSTAFLTMLGMRPAEVQLPPFLGQELRSGWPMLALGAILDQVPGVSAPRGVGLERVAEFVRQHWIAEQYNHHDQGRLKKARKSRRLERIGWWAMTAALAIALFHLSFGSDHGEARTPTETLLGFGAIVLPAIGVAVGGFRNHREYSRLAKRSENLAISLHDLEERLKETNDLSEIMAVVGEMEAITRSEVQDWLMLMHLAVVHPPG